MGIGSTLLLVAAFSLVSFGDGYERVGGGVATDREGRALMASLASDLSTAYFHKDAMIEQTNERWPKDRLGFLSLQAAHRQSAAGCIADLCAVSYHIEDVMIGDKTVRCLMRACRESQETFQALEGDGMAALFEQCAHGGDPMAFGVISFEARPMSRDDSGRWVPWVKNPLVRPDAIDLRVVMARRELAGKLKLPGDWDGVGTYSGMLGNSIDASKNALLEVFAARIDFGIHETR